MYIGIDFLIDAGQELYLSEINTGAPAGAFEYDLVFREQFNRPSGVFKKIDDISKKNFSLTFREYIRRLPYIADLRMLKIWMDGMGPFPAHPAPELRLEDKWIQYNILSGEFDMLPTEIYSRENEEQYWKTDAGKTRLVVKRRLGRGGREFWVCKKGEKIKDLEKPGNQYIMQPWIDSSIEGLSMSVRAASFCGEFICMLASLSPRRVSNHGYRFYTMPGNRLGLSRSGYRLKKVIKKSWEAGIFFGGDIPDYLEESVMVETVSDGVLTLPENIYTSILEISGQVSRKIDGIDCSRIAGSLIP